MAKFKPTYEYVCEVKVEATYEVILHASSYDQADELIDQACQGGMEWKDRLRDIVQARRPGPLPVRRTDDSVFGIITSTTEPDEVFDANEKAKALVEARTLLNKEGFLVVGDPDCYDPMTDEQALVISEFAVEVLT